MISTTSKEVKIFDFFFSSKISTQFYQQQKNLLLKKRLKNSGENTTHSRKWEIKRLVLNMFHKTFTATLRQLIASLSL